LEKEKELQEAREQSWLSLAVTQVKKQYGFVPDLNVTPFRNAVRLHQSKNIHSLPMPSNMAFHDLTPTKCAPRAAKLLLGLGSKFIPTSKFTAASIEPLAARFQRDFYLKVIFACEESEEQELAYAKYDKSRSKLYVKSKCVRRAHTLDSVGILFKEILQYYSRFCPRKTSGTYSRDIAL
jgi:hypothetical protein